MISPYKISSAASSLVKKYGTRDPEKIADELGIIIKYVDGMTKLLGMYTYILKHRVILINPELGEVQKKLVIAHELGHDALHRDIAKAGHTDYSIFDTKNITEYEANAFASHLLIDKEEMDSLAKINGFDPWQLSGALNVNVNLLLIRLMEENKMGGKYEIPYIPDPKFIKNETVV